MNESQRPGEGNDVEFASVLLGTVLTVASLIILPALAQGIGMHTSLAGALRSVLTRTANRL